MTPAHISLINWPELIGFTLYAVGLLGIVFFPRDGENALG